MEDRLTARDVDGQEFPRRMRGYDPEQVRMFLRSVAEEIERLNLENAELREEAGSLRRNLEEVRRREQTLQETLVTAQQMSEDLKERARAEAELLVKESRIKAERLLEQAQDQLARLEREIGQARVQRDTFENRLRNTLEEHLALLDLRREEQGEQDKLRFLRRRSGSEAG